MHTVSSQPAIPKSTGRKEVVGVEVGLGQIYAFALVLQFLGITLLSQSLNCYFKEFVEPM